MKVSVVDGITGDVLAQGQQPKQEMEIVSLKSDWAEQSPEMWFEYLKKAISEVLQKSSVDAEKIGAIGISYQMHGLVLVDDKQEVIRPSIIWCDSRAVDIGDDAASALGDEWTLTHLLNSPGNFTASKLKWVKENEPELYDRVDKFLLPGDYIAMRLSGKTTTTITGLSEGIFWDFDSNSLSEELLNYYGFDKSMIPEIVPGYWKHVRFQNRHRYRIGSRRRTGCSGECESFFHTSSGSFTHNKRSEGGSSFHESRGGNRHVLFEILRRLS